MPSPNPLPPLSDSQTPSANATAATGAAPRAAKGACSASLLRPAQRALPSKRNWCWRAAPFAAAWMVLFVAYAWPGDTTALGEWLTVWPPLLWGFVLVPLALPLVHWQARKPMACALAAVAVFALVHEEWWSLLRLGGSANRPSSAPTLRVLTWNISDTDMNRPEFRATLAAQRPDLCFLQETPHDDGAPRTGTASDDAADDYFAGWHWVDAGDCGVWSRWPVRELPTEPVGPWSEPQMLACERPGGRPLLLANVRLMLPSLRFVPWGADGRVLRDDHRQRVAQFPALAGLIEHTQDREGLRTTLLAGDFNTGGWARSLRPLRSLRGGLRDAWREGGRGWGRTMTAQFPVARLDQCWASDDLRCVRATVHGSPLSDHRLVAFEFEERAQE